MRKKGDFTANVQSRPPGPPAVPGVFQIHIEICQFQSPQLNNEVKISFYKRSKIVNDSHKQYNTAIVIPFRFFHF